MKCIGEKFEVNAANGTVGLTIPLPISPGRDGLEEDTFMFSGAGRMPFLKDDGTPLEKVVSLELRIPKMIFKFSNGYQNSVLTIKAIA